ncbi:MAG: helix-turn-helix transcriptional regulator [Clostridia bacterium]|nr:helix-turn-helix transcriptional regulator [Clostridia bacterium]MBR1821974.1 helix-turn-helix transcriptional regulator [Clostridia bacterium]
MGEFGKRLREVRQTREIMQEQLAEMADISRVMIGRYETTDQLPALDTLVRIADALGVSADYLLGRTDALDAPLTVEYVPPSKPMKDKASLPKDVSELEALIRKIALETLKENHLLDD